MIHSRKQADERFRNLVLHTAIMWGWRDPCLTFARRDEIAKAACRQVSYDLGYKAPLAHTRLPVWYGMVNAAITGGESTNRLSPSNSGRVTYVDALENDHPGYLRELFRYAERVIGTTATWQELAEIINQKSSAPGEERPTLSISRRQLSKWFQMQGGKEVSAIEKPLLTQEHKQRRIEWARRWFDVFSDPSAPVAFLDEKWFYTTNRRQQMKVLPTAANEIGIMTAYRAPRIRSRRHPAKVMFLGVVACPQLANNFDGRVCLHRVSKTKILSRSSKNKRFSVDQDVVQAIVSGEWKEQLATDGMTIDELLDDVKSQFDLDAYVSNRLVIGFDTYEGGVKKWKALEADDVISELGIRTTIENARVPVELKDLELFVQQSAGDEVEEDVSCDSDFMMRIMPQVGMALRTAYHWLGRDETIYLVMDNAGGHGSHDATARYTQLLWREFKVQVVWQVPRSPETNMLDLGIWMSIQAAVTRVHHKRQYHPDALAQSVQDAWNNYLSPDAFKNVHGRLRIVLHCIVEDNGGNNLVEQKRGKLFRDSVIEIPDDDDDEEKTGDDESVDMISISDD